MPLLTETSDLLITEDGAILLLESDTSDAVAETQTGGGAFFAPYRPTNKFPLHGVTTGWSTSSGRLCVLLCATGTSDGESSSDGTLAMLLYASGEAIAFSDSVGELSYRVFDTPDDEDVLLIAGLLHGRH